MTLNRRTLLKLGLAATSGTAANAFAAQESLAPKEKPPSSPDYAGVLVDTTLCIGAGSARRPATAGTIFPARPNPSRIEMSSAPSVGQPKPRSPS